MAKPLHEHIPKKLSIAGKTVRIELLSRGRMQDLGAWGRFHPDAQLIEVCPDNTPDHVLDTLLHEILHACYHCWNIKDHDDEERIVHTMASALQQLYTSNPHMLKCIEHYTKAARQYQEMNNNG